MSGSTDTGGHRVFALCSPSTEEVFAYGTLIAPADAALFSDREVPSFRLDATHHLVERLVADEGRPGDLARVVVSSGSRHALEYGLMDLVPVLHEQPSGRFIEAGQLVGAALPFLANPQGMTALLAVAAVTELAAVLEHAFLALQEGLQSLKDMLVADREHQRFADLATAHSAIEIGKLADVCLRAAGEVPSSVGIGPASQAVDALWLKYRGSLAAKESALERFLIRSEPRADDYVRELRRLLPYDVSDLQAELVVLGAAGVAKLYLDSVRLAETQLTIGRVQPLDVLLAKRAEDIEDTVARARRLVWRLARRDFGSDVRPSSRQPISGGFLTKMPKAMQIQRRLRGLDDVAEELLAPERFAPRPAEWLELELHRDGQGVVAKGRSHGVVSRSLSGDHAGVVEAAMSKIDAEHRR